MGSLCYIKNRAFDDVRLGRKVKRDLLGFKSGGVKTLREICYTFLRVFNNTGVESMLYEIENFGVPLPRDRVLRFSRYNSPKDKAEKWDRKYLVYVDYESSAY